MEGSSWGSQTETGRTEADVTSALSAVLPSWLWGGFHRVYQWVGTLVSSLCSFPPWCSTFASYQCDETMLIKGNNIPNKGKRHIMFSIFAVVVIS